MLTVYIDVATLDLDMAKHEKTNKNTLKAYQGLSKITQAYDKLKKKDYSADTKFWDMIFFIKTIGTIKLQEINQDDVYDIYIHYDK